LNSVTDLWADERLVYAVAVAAVATLVATVWLFRRQQKAGRGAAFVCLILAIGLHAVLLFLVPMIDLPSGGSVSATVESEQESGTDTISLSTFDPTMDLEQASADGIDSSMAPLPIDQLTDLLTDDNTDGNTDPLDEFPLEADELPDTEKLTELEEDSGIPETLAAEAVEQADADAAATASMLDDALGELFDEAFAVKPPNMVADDAKISTTEKLELNAPKESEIARGSISDSPASVTTRPASAATVPGEIESDFAARVGDAKYEALHRTGGDEKTEAAVQAALEFLATNQRDDGAWDPGQSGAGRELAPLGMTRAGAGTKSDTALTGLSLLALLGAGQTHQEGQYADNVYRGLSNLIQKQSPNGSLAGNATLYAANYAHGMAALSLSEAAVITRDPSAIASATRAVSHSLRMQHPSTGGWRYTRGDPGDLSQLGWQAMVIDAGVRAGVTHDKETVAGITRFLRSVRAGATGGLASYRPREAPSRTMTAEALATRLLIGEKVPQAEIREAERYLLQKLPGVGQDDYYYWYYATLALHQLQDDAWRQWNDALKNRLLATQRADGSWPSDTVWGGYGGTVYTTAMATLCLEAYYRHTIRGSVPRVARRR
jgi:hypothetical protein